MKGANAEGVGQFANLEIFQRTPSEFTVIKQLDPRVGNSGLQLANAFGVNCFAFSRISVDDRVIPSKPCPSRGNQEVK
jgi:hypothetical protein